MFKKIFGDKGEKIAAKYLQKKGYIILDKNVRTPHGEVDIITQQGDFIIFIEVKRRSNDKFGKGHESVGSAKQRKIINSSHYYCQKNNISALCRFDVISIDGETITHIENAFGE